MPMIFQGPLGQEAGCVNCGEAIDPEADAYMMFNEVYCSLSCIQEWLDADSERQGADFGANQDQAIAAVQEVLDGRPKQFVFFYETINPEDGDVGITMFCKPDFSFACVEVLARALAETKAPHIEPPPD